MGAISRVIREPGGQLNIHRRHAKNVGKAIGVFAEL
jgi:hypothetical protein